MNHQLKKLISLHKENALLCDKLIVSAFVKANDIYVGKNLLIKSLIIDEIPDPPSKFSFEELIEAFELAIPAREKVVNGAVYTPSNIKDFIIRNCIAKVSRDLHSCLVADISCGCGAFLYAYALYLHSST